MKLEFEVLGTPVAKGRPRLGKFKTYTPQKTKNYEQLVKYSFKSKYPKFDPFTCEIKARLECIFEVPKSYSKKKRESLLPIEGIRNSGAGYTHKPDCDNIAKAVLDALNGLAYVDDSQITCLLVIKEYGHEAKVSVEIEEIG